MSYYGVIFPEFWTGRTGRELRERGKDAQLIALYLATNRHANMLGLYHLLLDDVKHETGLGWRGVARGLEAVAEVDYARFDTASSFMWVRQMVRFRLGLQPGEALDPDDNRAKGVNRIYAAIDPNPFLGDFFDANHKVLRLRKRREPVGLVVSLSSVHHMSGLPSPYEAPYKPVNRSTGSGSGTGKNADADASARPPDGGAPKPAVIRALIGPLLDSAPPDSSFADLKELAKEACAVRGIPYDAMAVGTALEQALARKAKAS